MNPFAHRAELVRDAYDFAADAHAGQVKDADGSPYVDHLVTVARVVEEAGYDDEVVAAALLHDIVEKGGRDVATIRERFGAGVADLVAAMTEPEGVEPWERRKRAHRDRIAAAGPRAGALFAADKTANAAALRRAIRDGRRVDCIDGKVDHYRATLDMMPSAGDPVAAQLRSELDRLAAERTPAANRSHLRSPS